MATFTITATNTNGDSLAGKTGADTYNVNGGELIFDRHTRFGVNPSNSHGNINGSASLGGTIKFRSDKIRLIYFTGGSGNVPAYDTVISQGGASGKLIGVHSALNSAPITPGSAMPSSGYLQVTQWNSVAYASGALTGITATCAADPVFGTYDRAGFMIVVGRDSTNTNVSRLNNPNDDVFKGDWFLMGVTDGNRATTYQIPSNGDAMYIAGVQVETAPGSGVFEWWPVTSSAMTAQNLLGTGTDDIGKQCHITPATAQIRFGSDGTNSTGGDCPASGCRVRIPNMLLQSCTAGSPTTNSFSVMNSRHYFYGNGAGRYRMDKVSSAWRSNIVTNAYEVAITDSSLCENVLINSNATPYELTRVCVSMPVDAPAASHGLTLTTGAIGGSAVDCVFSLGNVNGLTRYELNLTSFAGGDFERCRFVCSGNTISSMCAINASINDNFYFNECLFVGWHNHSQSTNHTYLDCIAAGAPGAPTEVAATGNFMTLTNKSSGFLCSDWSFPRDETLAKAVFVALSGSSTNNKFRNMGSYADPISARGAIRYDKNWARSGTTITITDTAHGYRVGDYLNIMYGTSTAAHGSSGLKAVISVPDANTFTITGLNAGDTSGTITYFRTFCSIVASVGAGCDNNEFQNIWIEGAYSRSASFATGAYNVTAKNVYGGVGASSSYASGDVTARGVSSTAASPGAIVAQYGHTFADGSVIQDLSVGMGATGCSWTRSGTVITVTSPDHGMDSTGGTRIRVFNPSDTSAVGAATTVKSAVPRTKDTFTFAGAASGATSGTLDWAMPSDKLTMFMNEQSDVTQRYTIDAGTPAFTGAGAFVATSVGDQITWEMPEFLINYTGFPALPIETGHNELVTATAQGVYHFTYDIAKDGGAFSGTFKNLSRILTATGGTSGTPTMTFASTADIAAGDRVFGLNIPQGAYVASVDSGTQITLSANLLGTASGDYQFNHLPAETFTGTFKLKVRLKTLTANSLTNTYFNIPLSSDAASRAQLYPQTETVPITIVAVDENRNPVQDARVYIRAATGGPETDGTGLATGVTDVNGSFSTTYQYSADQPITGWVRKATGSPTYKQAQVGGTIESGGFETTVFLVKDE